MVADSPGLLQDVFPSTVDVALPWRGPLSAPVRETSIAFMNVAGNAVPNWSTTMSGILLFGKPRFPSHFMALVLEIYPLILVNPI